MKTSALLLVAFGIFAFTELSTASLDKWFEECVKSYGHTEESVSKLPDLEKSCVIHICFMRDVGLINEDNSLNVNYLLERRKSHVPESKIYDAVRTCNAESIDTLAKTCEAVKCLMDLLHESDFNTQPNVTD
ncbi:GOBP-like venom protein precursor [Nasonia vitripennis]|uniref:Putative odorant binding protein 67 n=1 Tax=Nasonia vitripennis TaxID=7425 RepID=G8B1S2_NASVI|nr:GOBP-like venom protein precursor [Nasonia vitripennis]CCD17836.1 putative odorant binding protein 67 [Nasonia vitripennis]